MANQDNIAALERLLEEFDAKLKRFGSPRYRAEWLAQRGVLIPSALTDEQAMMLATNWSKTRMLPAAVRHQLELLAKGE